MSFGQLLVINSPLPLHSLHEGTVWAENHAVRETKLVARQILKGSHLHHGELTLIKRSSLGVEVKMMADPSTGHARKYATCRQSGIVRSKASSVLYFTEAVAAHPERCRGLLPVKDSGSCG